MRNPDILKQTNFQSRIIPIDFAGYPERIMLAGSPVNAKGQFANDGSAIGILVEDVTRDYAYGEIAVAGFVDYEIAQNHAGISYTKECMTALKNIVFEGVGDKWIESGGVKTVNGNAPDENGNIEIKTDLPEYLALEIPDNAHKNDTALTDAYYPLARKVGENAFNGCSKLASVIAPYLRRIGMSAFRGCSALTTADFPHVTFIDLHAFENCDALTTVDFPAVHTVNSYAFKNCDKLTTINMPLIDTIGSEVFEACSSLTAVYFPNAIQILRYAFLNAYSLTTANFPLLKYIEEYAFQHCSKLATIDSPLVVRIGTSAFHGCSALTTADFPSCEEIYIKAFKDCTKLKSLILRKETRVTLRDANAFDSTPISEGTGYIYVPSALVDSYKAAAEWSTYANQFRALEDYTVDGTITGELDPDKI